MTVLNRFALLALLGTLAGCDNGDDSGNDGNGGNAQIQRVSGGITSNTTWTSDNTYLLQGAVFVRSGATLTIQAGTRVVGERSSLGTLVVERRRGDWGGLILNGAAPLNVPGGEKLGEGDTGRFGGSNVNDDSGVLRYVRVEFAGIEFSPDNELNGIAFQGTGANTVCDHLQVHFNQ